MAGWVFWSLCHRHSVYSAAEGWSGGIRWAPSTSGLMGGLGSARTLDLRAHRGPCGKADSGWLGFRGGSSGPWTVGAGWPFVTQVASEVTYHHLAPLYGMKVTKAQPDAKGSGVWACPLGEECHV